MPESLVFDRSEDIANQITHLPSELGQLVGLRSLELSGNPLGELPEIVFELKELEFLGIANVGLSIVPESIAQLTNLEILDLSNNQIAVIPDSIAQLTNLTELDLDRNQITVIPDSISKLTNLTELYLSNNQITVIPDSISKLTNLTELYLSNNQITVIPDSISKLTNLKILDLSSNQIALIPDSIAQLTNLTELFLFSNQIAIIPDSIAQLTNLTSLNFAGNQITVIPDTIAQLSNLTELNFVLNQIAVIPDAIAQLTNLTGFYLNYNQITVIPDAIAQLTNLTYLNLCRNQIALIPDSIAQLNKLIWLNLCDNQITVISDSIIKLSSLTWLSLAENCITAIPDSISLLLNLTTLVIASNQITLIPDSIAQLTNLTNLDLQNNRIEEVPKWITSLRKLEQLDLRKNPLSIPKDILDSDAETREKNQRPAAKPIFDYLLLTQDPDEINHLYETKLLFVGEGGSGKTSLARKLVNPESQLIPESEDLSTQGIDIRKWEFKGTNGNDYRIHLWDFGGQEIYHQTHQFFLTESALYLLLADSRKEDTDHPYWLNIIRLRSKNSPVLLIQNEKNDRHCNLNLRELRHEFTSLEIPDPINLATDRNLPELTKEIKHQLEKLLGNGLPFPNKWLNIRNILENETRNHITLTEYQTICTRNGITNEVEMLQLSAHLHRLGTCFHFQSFDLKELLILKPNWGTAACYKILDCDRVVKNLGQFTNEDLSNIWSDKQYTKLQRELLQLMKEFKICYEIPKNPGKYIAPHLLSTAPPDYDWNPENNLILRYQYPGFMPKGILTRFIVEMHKEIENVEIPDRAHVWKTGAILNKNNARAEIVENTIRRHIEIRLTGTRPRDLFILINHQFQDIHDEFDQLKYDTLIPCNCTQCKNTPDPYTYTLKSLETRLDNRKYTVQCDKSYEDVQVRRLIEDVLSIQDDNPDFEEPDFPTYDIDDRRPSTSPGKRSDRPRNALKQRNQTPPININIINKQDQTMSNDSQSNNFSNAKIANLNLARDNANQSSTNVTQTNSHSTEDLLKLITALRQTSVQFPTEIKQEIDSDLEDLEAEIIKPEPDRNPTRIKKRMAAIVTTIGLLASGVSGVADFTNTTIDLGEKLNIDIPALMGR